MRLFKVSEEKVCVVISNILKVLQSDRFRQEEGCFGMAHLSRRVTQLDIWSGQWMTWSGWAGSANRCVSGVLSPHTESHPAKQVAHLRYLEQSRSPSLGSQDRGSKRCRSYSQLGVKLQYHVV